jgi:hypothetical protein
MPRLASVVSILYTLSPRINMASEIDIIAAAGMPLSSYFGTRTDEGFNSVRVWEAKN